LAKDLDAAGEHEVLLTELKAAAVDVASMRAVARGAEVVFVDNRPRAMDGRDLEAAFVQVLDLAIARANDRTARGTGR
jgi:cyclic 2,3-diphosphoglycerate synthetase